jgi:hypothetical protein
MHGSIEVTARIERKLPTLPRYVVVPAEAVAPWGLAATTTVDVAVNDVYAGRLSLKKWDDDRWFLNISEAVCRRLGIDTGERVLLEIRLASTALPAELEKLLSENSEARARWDALTEPQRRMTREEIHRATNPATRRKRAARLLGLE